MSNNIDSSWCCRRRPLLHVHTNLRLSRVSQKWKTTEKSRKTTEIMNKQHINTVLINHNRIKSLMRMRKLFTVDWPVNQFLVSVVWLGYLDIWDLCISSILNECTVHVFVHSSRVFMRFLLLHQTCGEFWSLRFVLVREGKVMKWLAIWITAVMNEWLGRGGQS